MVRPLPEFLAEKYESMRGQILRRLDEFASVPEEKYFYELCFCVCTPQSRAKHAMDVQQVLEKENFLETGFDPAPLLRRPDKYIRFHNQKAARLLKAREMYPQILDILRSRLSAPEKRLWLADNFNGLGMKESAHFLRNIGYRGLGILDRHILKHLVYCGLFEEIPKIATRKSYIMVEESFRNYSVETSIDIDELDLLFWSYETGEILK
jgi:N-glycosylase/DNA lyase